MSLKLYNDNNTISSKRYLYKNRIVFSNGNIKYTESAIKEIIKLLSKSNNILLVINAIKGKGFPCPELLEEDLKMRENLLNLSNKVSSMLKV